MTKFLLVTGILLSLTVACSHTYVPRTTAGMRCSEACHDARIVCKTTTGDCGACDRESNRCWASCPGAFNL